MEPKNGNGTVSKLQWQPPVNELACSLCGAPGPFLPFFKGASLRECRCPVCGSSRRTRDLVRVLLWEIPLSERDPVRSKPGEPFLASHLEMLEPLHIYELQAQGALHSQLVKLPHYVCSEFLPGIPPGQRNTGGVLCQDASNLTFEDGLFDIVISQDVLEHMEDPWQGFAEIQRVLRPGGRHIFTVPLHEGRKTRTRFERDPSGKLREILPRVCHKDPLNPQGALVFWDYGDDLPDLLALRGITARKALHAKLYPPESLCDVSDGESYARCQEACANGKHAAFFLYNSMVFMTEKF